MSERTFIPKSETPDAMPDGIAVKYYVRWPGDFKEITTGNLKQIMENLRSGKWENIYLYHEADEEGDFMDLESGGGLYSLGYLKDMGYIWWSTYDPQYLDSNEETDIECSDGQSIIFRENTTSDKEAVMTAVEYFIRTGTLWNGISWMKGGEE